MVKTSPSNAGGAGSIPGRRAKIPHASGPENQNIKHKQYCNKFNKDFKNGSRQKNHFFKKNKKKQNASHTGSLKLLGSYIKKIKETEMKLIIYYDELNKIKISFQHAVNINI